MPTVLVDPSVKPIMDAYRLISTNQRCPTTLTDAFIKQCIWMFSTKSELIDEHLARAKMLKGGQACVGCGAKDPYIRGGYYIRKCGLCDKCAGTSPCDCSLELDFWRLKAVCIGQPAAFQVQKILEYEKEKYPKRSSKYKPDVGQLVKRFKHKIYFAEFSKDMLHTVRHDK